MYVNHKIYDDILPESNGATCAHVIKGISLLVADLCIFQYAQYSARTWTENGRSYNKT